MSDRYRGWFECLGGNVTNRQKTQAYKEFRKMGVDVSRIELEINIRDIANAIERDRPENAIEHAREYVDLAGAYRVLANLCVIPPVDENHPNVRMAENRSQLEYVGTGSDPNE